MSAKVLSREGKWVTRPQRRRVSNDCRMSPDGRHVFTSTKQIGDGPKVAICSWCERSKA